MLTDVQIIQKYGQPGDEKNFATINLPYPMRIAWDKAKTVNKMRCHKLVAQKFLNVFNELLTVYGYDKLRELEIDLFGGCYNFRKMRGSKSRWSRHAWAIAVDLSPEKNQLKWKKDKAQFAKAEYQRMIGIFYKHGFVNQGVELGYDYMHFETAD
jgi:hypothetical protein